MTLLDWIALAIALTAVSFGFAYWLGRGIPKDN